MYETIDWAAQHKLALQLQQAQTADRYYFVDIIGTCNLRCPSCAVGNMPALFAKGHMPLERFASVLDKIRQDTSDQERIFIDLYNWGEPLLHPKIGEIVKLVKKSGAGCGISSNLMVGKHLAAVAEAEPDYIRISLSGFDNAVYQQTHTGGDAEIVKTNMRKLREELDACGNSNTIVQVGFHIYRTNFPDDFRKMLELTQELGFLFSPTLATIMPVEKAVAVLEGDDSVSDADCALLKKLVISPQAMNKPVMLLA